MNTLLAAQALLGKALLADPRLALAQAAAWLDPSNILTHPSDSSDEAFDEAVNEITWALHLCRKLFPEVYAGASQLVWQGANEQTIDNFLLDGINAHLVMKLDALEEIPGGVPVEMLGVSFYEDDFFENYPQLVAILTDFGIQPDCTETDIWRAGELANTLYASVERQSGTTYHHLCSLLSWLFASSGNTCLDMTTEEFWESGIALLEWHAENVEAMNAMATEAMSIFDEAQAGLQVLQTDSELRQVFQHNLHKLLNASAQSGRKKGTSSNDRTRHTQRFQWPERP
ncbi:MAG: hypothetical protein ABI947_19285 [Chloroflexota bacterium]